MKKKIYVKPEVQAIEIESSAIIAGSENGAKNSQLQNYEREEWSDD